MIAIVAAEDWSIRVIAAPATMKIRIDPTPKPVRFDRKMRTGSLSSRRVEVARRVLRPRKSRAKPIRNSPPFLYELFFIEYIRKAKNISGTAMAPRLKEPSPKERAKIQAVTVVPMLAPMITPMAFTSDRRPAFTKLTSISVVAVEDWTRAVTTIPVSTRLKAEDVIEAMKLRNFSPASFCSPPLISDIP